MACVARKAQAAAGRTVANFPTDWQNSRMLTDDELADVHRDGQDLQAW